MQAGRDPTFLGCGLQAMFLYVLDANVSLSQKKAVPSQGHMVFKSLLPGLWAPMSSEPPTSLLLA